MSTMDERSPLDDAFRRALLIVAALNLGYFGIEFAIAPAIGLVSLFADSVDFLEDVSVNRFGPLRIICCDLGRPESARRRSLDCRNEATTKQRNGFVYESVPSRV